MTFKSGIIAVLVVVLALVGCSQVVSPVESDLSIGLETTNSGLKNQHQLWGLWTFICDPAKKTIDIIPLRNAEMHLNALHFLEPPVLQYLKLESIPKFDGNILDVDIGIIHPFLGQRKYTAFDVCGILITNGSYSWPAYSDLAMTMAGEGDTYLLNADGYSRWWNPKEFSNGGWDPVFKYKDGLLGTPDSEADFNCNVNGYKCFADELDKDDPLTVLDPANRAMFSPGKKNVRHYKIDISGGLVFNYAVDACWKMPQGDPPYDVPGDFPPEANRYEAYNIMVTELENDLYIVAGTYLWGGNLKLSVDIYDHYNAGLNVVYAGSLVGIEGETLAPVGGGYGYSTYELDISGKTLTNSGNAELLFSICCGHLGYQDHLPGYLQSSFFKYPIHISPDAPPGWALSWGCACVGGDFGEDVALDGLGNIYVTGHYQDSNGIPFVDFDPGPGVDFHSGNGNQQANAFLSKFNKNAVFQWACTWGGDNEGQPNDQVFPKATTVDSFGNIYVTGSFEGVIDFDPGSDVVEVTGHGAFISKFDTDGNFLGVTTWGESYPYVGEELAIDDNDNIYLVGEFYETVDFDPGPGIDEQVSYGNRDVFLCKFDSDGTFQWARTWGGPNIWQHGDSARGVAVDSIGNICVTGAFELGADFDPTPGMDIRLSNGGYDVFLCKYNPAGDYLGTITFGGQFDDFPYGVAADSQGNAYLTGHFHDTVDFDPGPGSEEHTTAESDSFLSKFNSNSIFQWVRVWDNSGAHDVGVDGLGYVYVVGASMDAFLKKFSFSGNPEWSLDLGISIWDKMHCNSVVADDNSNAFIAGEFRGTHDLNPGPGVDEHTSGGDWDVFLSKFPPDGNW